MTEKPDAVHLIHIAAPAQKVWDALTDADRSASYFFGLKTLVETGRPMPKTLPEGPQ